jgi:sugar lactone lactonase YvrE
VPDGLDIAEDGTMYVTSTVTGGIDVIRPDGRRHVLVIADDAYTTNCRLAFDGGLYVTDAADLSSERPAGRLWHIATDGLEVPA